MNRSHKGTFAVPGRPWIVAVAAALAALAAVIVLLAPSTEAAKGKAPVIKTAKSNLGQILVDARGRTLYLFEKDRKGKSACNGDCATAWPPLIAGAKPRVGGKAKAALVGTTRRADGRRQVTYKGNPLYTFIQDKKRGQTKGQGVDGFGAKWYVVSPAGRKVTRTP
jgi:predicted lipoprotein with Yx(FWY)xxD motif